MSMGHLQERETLQLQKNPFFYFVVNCCHHEPNWNIYKENSTFLGSEKFLRQSLDLTLAVTQCSYRILRRVSNCMKKWFTTIFDFIVNVSSCPIWLELIGPVQICHRSHEFAIQPSHSVDRAEWQAKMASFEIWIPWRNAHKPHYSTCILQSVLQFFMPQLPLRSPVFQQIHFLACRQHSVWIASRSPPPNPG